MSRSIYSLVVFLLGAQFVWAQSSSYSLMQRPYHLMDRLEIKSGLATPFHPTIKYFQREDIVQYALMLDTLSTINWSTKDRADLDWIYRDNNEFLERPAFPTTIGGERQPIYRKIYNDSLQRWVVQKISADSAQWTHPKYFTRKPLLKAFYKTPANLFEYDRPSFYLRANPILNLYGGQAQGDEAFLLFNQRGLTIRGGIDDRIFFYTNILETQARYPDYVNDRVDSTRAIPGIGLYKVYRSQVFSFTDGYDFLLAQGYIGFNVTRHVGVQFGHGRNVIGNGYRSLLLSDFSTNYLYLKLNWRIGKFHYQNIFAELIANSARPPGNADNLRPKKYLAAHYLNYDVAPNFSVGFYEAVVFSRLNTFEFQYLNPVILYRTVEQFLGSPDNVLIGLNARWNFLKRFQLYGQLMLDEFKFDELFLNRRKWWANKWGIQAGLKYIDVFGIDHLDLQAEINVVRPYTYSHKDSSAIYSNYSQPLAHPLGANFREALVRLQYQPHPKWWFGARFIAAEFGENDGETNFGGDIILPTAFTNRLEDGVVIGQGITARTTIIGLEARYTLFHNFDIEIEYFRRDKVSQDPSRSLLTSYVGGGIRWNISKVYMDF